MIKMTNISIRIKISKHSINKAKQRFHLEDYKTTKAELARAFCYGSIIEQKNKFDFVIEYKNMYLIVEGAILRTVLTKEQYEYKKEHFGENDIPEMVYSP